MTVSTASGIQRLGIIALLAALIVPAPAQAWHARAGGSARTFVVPPHNFNPVAQHNFSSGPPPHPTPAPAPHPQPTPHPPGPGPHPPGPPPPPPPSYYHDDWYHPWAAAAVVGTATAIVVGSVVASVPKSCVPVLVNGISYQQCGSTWYQPQYVGTSVQYVVVVAPR